MSLFADSLHTDVYATQNPHHLKERVHDFVVMQKKHKVLLFSVSIVFAVCTLGLVFLQQSSSWSVGFNATDGLIKADSNIIFTFSRPMSRNVSIHIEPEIPGNWYFENRLSRLHLSREFRFEPLETWMPDTTYTITFDELRAIFDIGDPAQNVAYTFSSQKAPQVTSLAPDDSESLAPDTIFTVTLDQPNAGLALFDVKTDPPVEFIQAANDDKTVYTFTPIKTLAQGTRYSAEVLQNDIRVYRESGAVSFESEQRTVAIGAWKTVEAPGILHFAPTGTSVSRTTDVNIFFSHMPSVDVLASISINPAVHGDWTMEESTAIFSPVEPLQPDTTYTVTIPKNLSVDGGRFFESDADYIFTTLGAVKAVAYSPGAGATGVAVDRSIRIDFDQTVDHQSAEDAFSITPDVQGSFSWDGATLIFSPSSHMALDTGYTVKLISGIAGTSGTPSNREYAFTFNTQPTVVRLDVPYDRQDYALSCEVAALKMALAYKGVYVSEDELMSHVGYDPTPHNGDVWGNPYNAFVGDIRGKQSTTGYGVYWDPIARAASAYREAESFTNGAVQTLTHEIAKGNPIVVWGNAGTGKRVDWKTPDGETIYAFNGEHARTVKGFIGPLDNPTHIIVNDPLYGEIVYATPSFEANWATLFKSGVIIK